MKTSKRTYEIGSVLLVRWLDSCLQDGWRESNEFMSSVEKVYSPVSTVGFVAFEDSKVIVLAGGWQTFDDSYHSAVVIPKSSIQTADKLLTLEAFNDLRLGIAPDEKN